MTKRRVLLAGGGTAGHVNPLLAVGTRLRDLGWDVQVLGTAEGLESQLVPAAGFPLTVVPKVPLPRKPSPQLLTLPGRLVHAREVASEALAGAEVVIGFGGYVSVPAYWAARSAKVPVVIHEQNARPGLANRWAARFAAAVAVTFAGTDLHARRGLTETTGLPLRAPIAALVAKRATQSGLAEARARGAEALGLDPDRPTLLITGGSLGAQHLNETMVQAAEMLPAEAQVLHLTGRGKDGPVREHLPASVHDRWQVRDYLATMEDALAVADLVVCRSGAGTVAELSALGVPAIYVPLPIGNGEQRLNAADVVAAGGAELFEDAAFSQAVVTSTVFPLLADAERRARMGEAARNSSVGDGTEAVINLALKVAKA